MEIKKNFKSAINLINTHSFILVIITLHSDANISGVVIDARPALLDDFKLFDKDLRRRLLLHLDDLKHALRQFLL